MSAFARVTSASFASWVGIIGSAVTQIVLVPVYLAYWNKETYGIWLAVQAIVSLSQIIDASYQNFLGYEFLRMGSNNRNNIVKLFSSSLPIAIMIGLFDLIVLVGSLVFVQYWPFRFGHPILLNSNTFHEVTIALVAQSLASLLSGTAFGVATRVVVPFGYYPLTVWWGVGFAIFTGVAPVVAVIYGAGILGAGVACAMAVVIYKTPFFWFCWNILRRENLLPVKPDILLGLNMLLKSQILTLKTLLEMLRQQGARLVLAPLSGAGELAAFATMRTGANTALQGLSTITNPVMPELMRFLNQRDQARTEAAFSTVWVVVVAAMTPSVVILQVIVAPLFKIWTHGKIEFDPVLFALLSLGVLVYAAAQPAMAVVQGNNLLRPQLILSGLAGGVVVGGMFLLVPHIGIRGAGWSLLMGEIVAAIGYVKKAAGWLGKNHLLWPEKAFNRVILSVLAAGIAMFGIALFPKFQFVFLALGLVALTIIFMSYWRHLPYLAKQQIAALLMKLPGGRRLAAALV